MFAAGPCSNKMAQWSDELCLKLIELYKSKTILWDPKNRSYYNRASKDEAWRDIAASMEEKSLEDCKSKMLSLQASYRREKSREKRIKERSNGYTSFISRWYAYEALRFLEEPRQGRDARRSYNTNKKLPCANTESTEQCDYSPDIPENRENENYLHTDDHIEMEDMVIKQEDSTSQGHDVSPEEDRGVKRNRDYIERDQYTVFGELVGMQVRDLPSPHAQKVVKHLINNILFKAEMGKYNDPLQEYYDLYS